MSEYVGVKDDIGNGLANMYVTDEPIVRCMDCKLKFEQGGHEFCRRNHNQDGEAYMVEPDGFCKWGEKRDD